MKEAIEPLLMPFINLKNSKKNITFDIKEGDKRIMSKNSMTKLIIGSSEVHNANKGCEALTWSLLMMIDDLFREAGQEYSLVLTDNGIQDSRKVHSIDIAGRHISYRFSDHAIITSYADLCDRLKRVRHGLRAYRFFLSADKILAGSWGDSFTDIYGQSRFRSTEKIIKDARRFHIPYCLLPQTIGPFSNESISKKAAKILNRSALVMPRDKASALCYGQLLPGKQVKEYIDMAFSLPFEPRRFESGFIHVGINVSALLWNGGYTRSNQFGLAADYQSLIRKLISGFLAMKNVKVHLVPHVLLGESGIENDFEVCRMLGRDFEGCVEPVEFFLNCIEAKNYISGLDFFMGARMHSTIAAFSSGVPVVPMAYSRKFGGLFEDTLNYRNVADMKSATEDELYARIMESFQNRDILKTEVDKANAGIVKDRLDAIRSDLKVFLEL